jgi:hypothetical protein
VHTTLGPTISVIHFHVKLTINTPNGVVNWFKQYEDAGSKDIWPISPTNQVTDLFATKMHEARAALPPTGHDWKGIGLLPGAARARCVAHASPQATSHGINKKAIVALVTAFASSSAANYKVIMTLFGTRAMRHQPFS